MSAPFDVSSWTDAVARFVGSGAREGSSVGNVGTADLGSPNSPYYGLPIEERRRRIAAAWDAVPESTNVEWLPLPKKPAGPRPFFVRLGSNFRWLGDKIATAFTEDIPAGFGRAAGSSVKGAAQGLGLPSGTVLLVGGGLLLLLLSRK